MNLVIRRMEPGDLDAAKRVILGVAARLFAPEEADGFVERWWLRLTDVDDWPRVYGPPRGTFLVALDGGRVVGTGAVRPIDDETAELKRMWLLEAYQGRGIGYRLFTVLAEFARAAHHTPQRLAHRVGISLRRAEHVREDLARGTAEVFDWPLHSQRQVAAGAVDREVVKALRG